MSKEKFSQKFRQTAWIIKQAFYEAVRAWNSTHQTRSNLRGFNRECINNEEHIVKLVNFLCKEVHRGKVRKDGTLAVTRSFIAKDIARSEPTVDAYLRKLKDLGFVKAIEQGCAKFGGKAISCIYVMLDLSKFVWMEVKPWVQVPVCKSAEKKDKPKSFGNQDFRFYMKPGDLSILENLDLPLYGENTTQFLF